MDGIEKILLLIVQRWFSTRNTQYIMSRYSFKIAEVTFTGLPRS